MERVFLIGKASQPGEAALVLVYSWLRFFLPDALHKNRYLAFAVVVQLNEHDLLPPTFYQLSIFHNHGDGAGEDHGLSMRVAVDALMHNAAGVSIAQVGVSLAFGIPGIAHVIVPVVFFWIGKPIQHPGQVTGVAQLLVWANQIFFIFVYPNAGRGVEALNGHCPHLHAGCSNCRLHLLGDGNEFLPVLGVERVSGRGGDGHEIWHML